MPSLALIGHLIDGVDGGPTGPVSRAAAARAVAARTGAGGAATKLAEAAEVLSRHPIAVQLRYLQTMRERASERNAPTFFPLPMDLFTPLLQVLGATPPPKS
jgi:hypothetical protein